MGKSQPVQHQSMQEHVKAPVCARSNCAHYNVRAIRSLQDSVGAGPNLCATNPMQFPPHPKVVSNGDNCFPIHGATSFLFAQARLKLGKPTSDWDSG